jgi:hypothetical protein
MLLEHQGIRPRIHGTAYVAPTATIGLVSQFKSLSVGECSSFMADQRSSTMGVIFLTR